MYGVGPIYVYICIAATIAGIILTKMNFLSSGDVAECKAVCYVMGELLIVMGIVMWIIAVVVQKIEVHGMVIAVFRTTGKT